MIGETHWDRAAREATEYMAARDARIAAREEAARAEEERVGALTAWLTSVLDEEERSTREATTDDETGADESDLIHPARAALARVEAERGLLRLHVVNTTYYVDKPYCEGCDDGDVPGYHGLWPCPTLRWLAYGHRFDREGWRPEWAPEGVEPTP